MKLPIKYSLLALFLGLCGCSKPVPTTVDTGAKQIAQEYCDAIVRKDWNTAYAALHPENRNRWSLDQYTSLVESYRRNMGFEPQIAHIRSSEEQGEQTVVHVIFNSGSTHHRQQYKDGLILRPHDGTWRVVLPQNFGKK